MAKGVDIESQVNKIIMDAKSGVFSPVYLLMGEESFYTDKVCDAIVKYALSDMERDFNQTIYYGLDVTADTVASEARSYPMMSERRLVVLKEAQTMRSLEELGLYCADPMDSTVLVIQFRGSGPDKRKNLYKNISKNGVIVDSPLIRDYELDRWITKYFKSKGIDIAPEASMLFAESTGVDLSRIAVETDKILKNLPEGTTSVSVSDIEKNVGMSRQFSIFELTKELSYRNSSKALKIAAHLGSAPKFAVPMAVSALYTHFYRILKYQALMMQNRYPTNEQKIKVLAVNPYFFKEYDTAVTNYPFRKTCEILSLLEEYDYKGKGGDAGEAGAEQLMVELVSKILN